MRGLLLSVVLSGCATAPTFVPVETAPESSAIAAAVSVEGLVRETFEVGPSATTPIADYLFVLDGSPSMKNVVDRLRAGFLGLAAAAPFPEGARIAVVSTIPGDPADLGRAHPRVDKGADARLTPGFLAPVDRRSITLWRGFGLGKAFRFDGCDGWFGARDTNAEGVPCILAHTETTLKNGPVEAGLTVLSQLLGASEGRLFREGASANVIFVSDTHDPGLAPYKKSGKRNRRYDPSLVESRPTWEQLRELAASTHTLAGFRLHAIAPESECSEVWAELGPSYFIASEASGGRALDICTARAPDYAAFVSDIAASGDALDRPVVTLGQGTDEVLSVEIGGVPVPWVWGDGRTLVLTEMPAAGSRVDVIYRPAPGASSGAADAALPEISSSDAPVATPPARAPIARGPAPTAAEVIRLAAGADLPGEDEAHDLVIDLSAGRCSAVDRYGAEVETLEGSCQVVDVDGAWTAIAIAGEEEPLQVARFGDLEEPERQVWLDAHVPEDAPAEERDRVAQDWVSRGWAVAGAGLDRVYVGP